MNHNKFISDIYYNNSQYLYRNHKFHIIVLHLKSNKEKISVGICLKGADVHIRRRKGQRHKGQCFTSTEFGANMTPSSKYDTLASLCKWQE